MRQHNKDLFLLLILTVVDMLWACCPTYFAIISIVVAFPLVFLAPGYLLIELLTKEWNHDGTTHLLLCIGLSLSIDILTGFLLNITPVGLTTLTWNVSLGVLIIASTFLCIVKRRRWQAHRNQNQKDLPTLCEFLLLTLTIGVVIFAFKYTSNINAKEEYNSFTRFWLLLDKHQTHICIVELGIDSSQTVTTTYQVEVRVNGQHAAHWSSIVLAPQQKWGKRFPLVINRVQTTQLLIVADLYRQQEPNSVYRTVQGKIGPC